MFLTPTCSSLLIFSDCRNLATPSCSDGPHRCHEQLCSADTGECEFPTATGRTCAPDLLYQVNGTCQADARCVGTAANLTVGNPFVVDALPFLNKTFHGPFQDLGTGAWCDNFSLFPSAPGVIIQIPRSVLRAANAECIAYHYLSTADGFSSIATLTELPRLSDFSGRGYCVKKQQGSARVGEFRFGRASPWLQRGTICLSNREGTDRVYGEENDLNILIHGIDTGDVVVSLNVTVFGNFTASPTTTIPTSSATTATASSTSLPSTTLTTIQKTITPAVMPESESSSEADESESEGELMAPAAEASEPDTTAQIASAVAQALSSISIAFAVATLIGA